MDPVQNNASGIQPSIQAFSAEEVFSKFRKLALVLDAGAIEVFRDLNVLGSEMSKLENYKPKPPSPDFANQRIRRTPFDPQVRIDEVAAEIEKISSLTKAYPDVSFTQYYNVAGAVSKESLRQMSHLSREAFIFQVVSDSELQLIQARLGDKGSASSTAEQTLCEQGLVAWCAHNHPETRIPVPSFSFHSFFSSITQGYVEWKNGDIATAKLVKINFVLAREGCTSYSVDDDFEEHLNNSWPIYKRFQEAFSQAEESGASASKFFKDQKSTIEILGSFGINIEYYDFESDWNSLDELIERKAES